MSPWAVIRLALISLPAALFAAGCDHPAPPSPPVTLRALERPLVQVDGTTQPVTVPPATVTRRGGIPGVFVLGDGLARFRMVKPGKSVGGRLQIISGLKGDESLVAGDLSEVRDGSPITAADN
jgi:multidrug efflux pump subunit AcrA (membrane-fusion protein)